MFTLILALWPFYQLHLTTSICSVQKPVTFVSCSSTCHTQHTRPPRHRCKIIQTHTRTQPFYGSLDFVRDNPGDSVPEETFTHSNLSWSSIIPYQLPPSITIHDILSVQVTCLTIFFHNLSPSFLWSTSWSGTPHLILRTFLHPIIVFFSQHMPISLQPILLQYRDYVI